MSPPDKDPYLPTAQYAVRDFDQDGVTAEQALATIWEQMKLAAKAGFDTDPYVKLTDLVTFPDEKRDVDADKERAAAEWMNELAQREPEND